MLMKSFVMLAFTLTASHIARADFSYATTQKTTGGSMGQMMGANGDRSGKYYFKGQKMMTSTGDTATIIDFDAQTVTTLNTAQKTYVVKKISDIASAETNTDISIDVKDTGQKKNVNGFNASEMIVTANMDMDSGRGGPAMKMQVEIDMWLSSDIPGAGDLRAFYQRNMKNFPWNVLMAGNGNPGMQKAMAVMQRKLAEMNGVVVEQVIRMKPQAGMQMAQMPAAPQMTSAQAAQMQAAMAQMQAMAKQGGAAAAAAQKMMDQMGSMGRGPAGGSAGGSGALIELTTDSTGFSNAAVPDSVFAIPDGYRLSQ